MQAVQSKGRVLGNRQTLLDGGVEARQCIHVTVATGAGHARLLDILIDATRSGIVEPFSIQARPCDLVIHLKKQIEELTGLKLDGQRLTLSGHTLANERRLCDCGIREKSILQVTCANGAASAPNPSIATSGCRAPRAQMDASAKKHRCQGSCLFLTIIQTWPPQRRRRLWLQKARTIGQLKEGLQDFFQVTAEKQLLMHAGRMLQNQHTLEYYNLEGGECIQLMLQGGLRVAAGPVALRAESPTHVTLPLPPKPSNFTAAPDWFPRILQLPRTVQKPLPNSGQAELEGASARVPTDPEEQPAALEPDEAEPSQPEEATEPEPGESPQVRAGPDTDELVLQASMALLAHAMDLETEA